MWKLLPLWTELSKVNTVHSTTLTVRANWLWWRRRSWPGKWWTSPVSTASSPLWWGNPSDPQPVGVSTRRLCRRSASSCWSSSLHFPAWWWQWRCPQSRQERARCGISVQGWWCWTGSWGSNRWFSKESSDTPGSWDNWSAHNAWKWHSNDKVNSVL